jgi:hypothetical protein
MFDQHLTGTRHQFLDKRVECADHRHQRHSVVLNELIVSLGASQFGTLTRRIYGRPPAGWVRMTHGVKATFLVGLGVEQLL